MVRFGVLWSEGVERCGVGLGCGVWGVYGEVGFSVVLCGVVWFGGLLGRGVAWSGVEWDVVGWGWGGVG